MSNNFNIDKKGNEQQKAIIEKLVAGIVRFEKDALEKFAEEMLKQGITAETHQLIFERKFENGVELRSYRFERLDKTYSEKTLRYIRDIKLSVKGMHKGAVHIYNVSNESRSWKIQDMLKWSDTDWNKCADWVESVEPRCSIYNEDGQGGNYFKHYHEAQEKFGE